MINLFDAVENGLEATNPEQKIKIIQQINTWWQENQLKCSSVNSTIAIETPGRPEFPRLVAPKNLPKRSVHTEPGFAALVHAIAHIEFNAMNLALDAIYRFRNLPSEYYGDWIIVAKEEALHYKLISEHLISLGYKYGDFEAHNGLWEIAESTKNDVLVRMALVPRVFEARGLDVTPGIIEKFRLMGDNKGVEILNLILHDEIGHVAVGTRWFRHVCDLRGLPHESTFAQLIKQHLKGSVKSPIHREARLKAGFSNDELDYLEHLALNNSCL